MKSKIAFITPKPMHRIYQNTLVYKELLKRGWYVDYNKVDSDTTHLFCMSNSQYPRTEELHKQYPNTKIISWLADISYNYFNGWEDPIWIKGYIIHIRNAWKVLSICTKMKWAAIKHTGRKLIDLAWPCIDNHTINKLRIDQPKLFKYPKKKNQIVVVGSMAGYKEPHIPLLAWEQIPLDQRPQLIYISYGCVTDKSKLPDGDYDKDIMGIDGLMFPQLVIDAARHGNMVKFVSCDDINKFIYMAQSKLLIMPSSFGGFNLPPIESWFCGTTSIISDDHWSTDLPDSIFRKFKTNDVSDLKFFMDRLFTDDDVRLKTRTGDYDFMQRYTVDGCCDRLEMLFSEWGMIK